MLGSFRRCGTERNPRRRSVQDGAVYSGVAIAVTVTLFADLRRLLPRGTDGPQRYTVREGATVILPVYHPGALLFVGDGHALQGDGEPTGNGIETSLDVEFSVALRKKLDVNGPRVENAEYIISVGAQPEFSSDLNRALQMATTDMVRWLTREYKIEPWAAHLLIAFQGKYDVITVAGCMGLRIPKKALPAN